jgi:hypothetical protein
MHFWILLKHISARHCHYQGVVVSSEATQAVSIVDGYDLRPVQSSQMPRDATKRVQAMACRNMLG